MMALPSIHDREGRIPRSVEPPLVPPQQILEHVVLLLLFQQEGGCDRLAAVFLCQAADETRTERLARHPSPYRHFLAPCQSAALLLQPREDVVEVRHDLHPLVGVEIHPDSVLRLQQVARDVHLGRSCLHPMLLHQPLPLVLWQRSDLRLCRFLPVGSHHQTVGVNNPALVAARHEFLVMPADHLPRLLQVLRGIAVIDRGQLAIMLLRQLDRSLNTALCRSDHESRSARRSGERSSTLARTSSAPSPAHSVHCWQRKSSMTPMSENLAFCSSMYRWQKMRKRYDPVPSQTSFRLTSQPCLWGVPRKCLTPESLGRLANCSCKTSAATCARRTRSVWSG